MRSSLASEIKQLQSLLSRIPEGNVIQRASFQNRLVAAQKQLDALPVAASVETARLTFRGRPVSGSHGIAAEFAGKAARAFSDAFNAISAGMRENLNYMGPIPDKAKNRLLITGTAIGSFGFEFEVPKDSSNAAPGKEPRDALSSLQKLMEVSAEGADEDIAELVQVVHPRAVRKVATFLNVLVQEDAWCGLEFRDHFFRYKDVTQLRKSANRLKPANIHEERETKSGRFLGFLPESRTFEFQEAGGREVMKGRIGPTITDPETLNREWLYKYVDVTFLKVQVGQGRPRYTLEALTQIALRVS